MGNNTVYKRRCAKTQKFEECSYNTRYLNVEETKAKIASLEYIQNELNGIANLAQQRRYKRAHRWSILLMVRYHRTLQRK